jgi:hypothetical protein
MHVVRKYKERNSLSLKVDANTATGRQSGPAQSTPLGTRLQGHVQGCYHDLLVTGYWREPNTGCEPKTGCIHLQVAPRSTPTPTHEPTAESGVACADRADGGVVDLGKVYEITFRGPLPFRVLVPTVENALAAVDSDIFYGIPRGRSEVRLWW